MAVGRCARSGLCSSLNDLAVLYRARRYFMMQCQKPLPAPIKTLLKSLRCLLLSLGADMRRREFHCGCGRSAAWPLAARAQAERVRRVGVLMNWPGRTGSTGPSCGIPARPAGSRLGGWPQRADRHRWSAGDARVCAETRRKWSRSVRTSSWPVSAEPFRRCCRDRTVPIVFAQGVDPVGAGFVASLSRPGTNATGFNQFEYSLSGKWLELLREIAPDVARVAVLRESGAAGDRTVGRHPGRGAIARRGVEPDRSARCRRDRPHGHGVCARPQWRLDRGGQRGR